MPTRASAPRSSCCTSRMPSVDGGRGLGLRSAASSARSKLSSAGSSSRASSAMPRASASADLAARALAEFSKLGLVRWSARGTRARPRSARPVGRGLGGAGLVGAAAVRGSPALVALGACAAERRRPSGLGSVSAAACSACRLRRPRGGVAAPSAMPRASTLRPRARRRPAAIGRLALVHDLGVDDVLLLGGVGAAPSPSADAPLAAACCCWARSYIASETLWKAACSASVLALISLGVLGRQRLADVLDRGLDLAPWRPRRPARRGP